MIASANITMGKRYTRMISRQKLKPAVLLLESISSADQSGAGGTLFPSVFSAIDINARADDTTADLSWRFHSNLWGAALFALVARGAGFPNETPTGTSLRFRARTPAGGARFLSIFSAIDITARADDTTPDLS